MTTLQPLPAGKGLPGIEDPSRIERLLDLAHDRPGIAMLGRHVVQLAHADAVLAADCAAHGDDFFELDSDDQKRVYLERKYGEKIYGLNVENLGRLINDLRDEFIQAFRRKVLA